MFFPPCFSWWGTGGGKLWNHSTYFVTKDAKLCKLIIFKCTHVCFFFLFVCLLLPPSQIFCCCSACSAWSVIFKPLSYLIFIQHSYCKIVCEQCKWGRGGGEGWCRVGKEKNNLVLLTLVTEKWSEPCFVHLNGVWISYANSFVTLQILMYLNKSNIQIPKYVCFLSYKN